MLNFAFLFLSLMKAPFTFRSGALQHATWECEGQAAKLTYLIKKNLSSVTSGKLHFCNRDNLIPRGGVKSIPPVHTMHHTRKS